MKLTPEQLKMNAAAMIAFADGKPVQGRTPPETEWITIEDNVSAYPHWNCSISEYRPKPEPTSRPWSKPEDVPLNCWIRYKSNICWPMLALGFTQEGIQYAGAGRGPVCTVSWDKVYNIEYSTDRKTWLPCVVTEEPQ